MIATSGGNVRVSRAAVRPCRRALGLIGFILAGSACGDTAPRVAIVIDDLGFSLKMAREVAALPCPLSASIIPLTACATASASLLTAAGKEVMIHMPMGSRHKPENVPEYVIMLQPGMSSTTVERCIDRAFESVPGAVAMNNHEGSLATEDPRLMALVMACLGRRHVAFLDSMTTERTVAWQVARDAGLPWARNEYFLDDDPSTPAVEAAFTSILAHARSRGTMVVIGHGWRPRTMAVLARRIPEAMRAGIEFVPVTALMNPAP